MPSLLKDSVFVFLRVIATMLDIAVAGLLTVVVGLGLSLTGLAVAVWFGVLMIGVGWCWLEAEFGHSPGKLAFGLELEQSGDFRLRFMLSIWRNLVKYCLLWMIFWFVGDIGKALLASQGLLKFPFLLLHPVIWLPFLGMGVMLLSLRLFKSDRLPQDLLSGSRIARNYEPNGLSSPFFAGLGVLLLYGGLTYVLLSSPWVEGPRPSISSVKANMHTFQTIVETYAVDWNGVYPRDIEALKLEATIPGREYWKDFANPYSGRVGPNGSYGSLSAYPKATEADAGKVLYDPIHAADGKVLRYYVYGLDKNGKRIQDRGQDFTLSNS